MSTKKLAKELGLLRQRSQSSSGSKKSLVTNQIFSYLIVIDFESTCWKEKNNYSQEIIEFPAVLLNTSTGEIESEFHTYVQPQEHPILSSFCTELTGITQMQVEAGIPLQICLSRFSRWLHNLQLQMGVVFPRMQQMGSAHSPSQKLCTFLTWSDWDLGVCLQYECKRKQLHKPAFLNSWIDLRSTYRLFYNRKPKGLNGALQDLGIQFSGREHSGLDDSRNTAKLAARMMRDGCVMKITRSLERAPSVTKPMFGNTAADQIKNLNVKNNENTHTTNNLSSIKIPLTSCSEKSLRQQDKDESSNLPQESICQTLISPKTLLNGSVLPLLKQSGSKSVQTVGVTHLSSSLLNNCPSVHSELSSLVLCSTTVGSLQNLPQPSLLSETRVTLTEDTDCGEILVETEERCCSYDDVVLDCDAAAGKHDEECVSAFDSEYCMSKEPDISDCTGDVLRLKENIDAVNNSEVDVMTNELPPTVVRTKVVRSNADILGDSNKMMQLSATSKPGVCFSVPKTVRWGSKTYRQQTGIKTVLQGPVGQDLSNRPLKWSETNTSSLNGSKSFVPGETSTPNTFFARPKAAMRQHTKPREASFTIYTDPTKQLAAPSHLSSVSCLQTPKGVLSSLSTNTALPLVRLKEGGKITSPLCACGRRAKRQVVSNGGPNNGRGFYCCPVRRSGSGGRIQKGCEFFKWESSLMKPSAAARSSVSICQVNPSPNCCPKQRLTLRKSI